MITCAIVAGLYQCLRQSSNTSDTATIAARATMSRDIFRYADMIAHFKKSVGEDRNKFAHPPISQDFLELFLNDLGASESRLTHHEVQLFYHLRTTTIQRPKIKNQPSC
jgi:hypothetical protein